MKFIGWIFGLFAFLLLTACSASRLARRYAQAPTLANAHVGLCVLDAATGQEIMTWQPDQYFTPASNIKILTLAACLEILGDTLPRLRYRYYPDEIDSSMPGPHYLLQGTGDPTWLHPAFEAWQPAPAFLRNPYYAWRILVELPGFSENDRFGPGWSWDDFPEYYSPERSPLPLYGNCLTLRRANGRWSVFPARFQDSLLVSTGSDQVGRAPFSGRITAPAFPDVAPDDTYAIPLYRPYQQAAQLLNDTLHANLGFMPVWKDVLPERWSVCPADTVYRRMMHQSDNFIAEQLLLLCGGERYDQLSQLPVIRWMRDTVWQELANPPRWVDGSGLSRYNLVTPRYFTGVLHRLWRTQPRERLFDWFPAGGVNGVAANWYLGPDGKPFVYAKSGSLGGVYCLGGYLRTQKGRVLIFSAMHNGFTGSNRPVKSEMQRFLEYLYRQY